jgi:hypothetical protein
MEDFLTNFYRPCRATALENCVYIISLIFDFTAVSVDGSGR